MIYKKISQLNLLFIIVDRTTVIEFAEPEQSVQVHC